MIQQSLAIFIIVFFIIRLFLQKRKGTISGAEFLLWFFFWSASLLVIVFIRQIDSMVAYLGFSSSGINVLLYLSIAWLFNLLFRVRLKIEKLEKEISELCHAIALKEK
jgi:hypothetical protein